MRMLAIGDIHGCLTAFNTLLDVIQLSADDQLITLGDYVDRGPDSFGVIERLIGLHQSHRIISLRGNHEVMMGMAVSSSTSAPYWLRCGGKETLESYPQASFDAVPDTHWTFLNDTLLRYHETDTHIFVHAGVDALVPMAEQPDDCLYWQKLDIGMAFEHSSGKIVVCGHSEQRSGIPLNLGHTICIDTWAYRDGWLTALDVRSGKYWQANQRGQTRIDYLPRIRKSND